MSGENQFNSAIPYIIILITIITAISQIYWINMGLERYDALLQIPVFYVVWTIFDIIGGGIYFHEFVGYSLKQLLLFSVGLSLIFVGIVVLAGRLKKIT